MANNLRVCAIFVRTAVQGVQTSVTLRHHYLAATLAKCLFQTCCEICYKYR